jgi:hypothetical protein
MSNIKRHMFHIKSPSGIEFKAIYDMELVTVRNNKKEPITGSLYIGKTDNEKEACLTITVSYPKLIQDFYDRFGRSLYIDPSIAHLVLVKYSPTCSEGSDLLPGTGTVEMIETGMAFLKSMCPFVNEFKLTDASSKTCDNGSTISLPYFYLVQKGKTWYEGRFGAYLKPESEMIKYKEKWENIRTMPLDEFVYFKSRYLNDIKNPDVITAIQNVYTVGQTHDDFFKKMIKTYGVSMMCILLQGWIHRLMKDADLELPIAHQSWYIPADHIDLSKYSFKIYKNKYTTRNLNNTTRKRLWNNKGNYAK